MNSRRETLKSFQENENPTSISRRPPDTSFQKSQKEHFEESKKKTKNQLRRIIRKNPIILPEEIFEETLRGIKAGIPGGISEVTQRGIGGATPKENFVETSG